MQPESGKYCIVCKKWYPNFYENWFPPQLSAVYKWIKVTYDSEFVVTGNICMDCGAKQVHKLVTANKEADEVEVKQ